MRRIRADRASLERQEAGEPGKAAAFRSMAVDHVRPYVAEARLDAKKVEKVARVRQPPDGQPQESECEARTQLLQHAIGLGAAGQGIRDQADFMAAGDLLAREIENVTEKPAKWRAEHMDDPQRSSRASFLLSHCPCPFLPAIGESGC